MNESNNVTKSIAQGKYSWGIVKTNKISKKGVVIDEKKAC